MGRRIGDAASLALGVSSAFASASASSPGVTLTALPIAQIRKFGNPGQLFAAPCCATSSPLMVRLPNSSTKVPPHPPIDLSHRQPLRRLHHSV
jgi:hypothetical protein